MPQTETLLEFAQQVAAWLGQRWSVDGEGYYGHRVALSGPDGENISLSKDGYDWAESKRVIVTGSYPRYNNHMVIGTRDLPKITAALERGPEAVAGDIERRFLPQYRQLVQAAQEAIGVYAEKNAKAREMARRFAEAAGGELSDDRSGYDLLERPTVRFGNSGDAWGKAEVTGDDFHIEARHVPADLAVKIGALLREYQIGEVESNDRAD